MLRSVVVVIRLLPSYCYLLLVNSVNNEITSTTERSISFGVARRLLTRGLYRLLLSVGYYICGCYKDGDSY